jgi:predicted phage-related endonuclease
VSAWFDLMDARQRIEALEEKEKILKGLLMTSMGEAQRLMLGDRPIATWKTQTRNALDQAALKAAHPDLVAQFTRETSARMFLPKKLKGLTT